jgi:serine/threonine protein kinase
MLSHKYRLIKELSGGGMGYIYLAEHVSLKKLRVVKIIRFELLTNPTMIERFLLEIKITHQLNEQSDHIVFLHDDYGYQEDIGYYYVMEYMDGETLAERIDSQAGFHLAWIVQIAIEICEAMDIAHQLGIIHRDLKPENIFLAKHRGRTDFVKIFDFGIAKMINYNSASTEEVKKTAYGHILGTPLYMSPEQISGPMSAAYKKGTEYLDGRADIYSLGCILYELLAGRPPFILDESIATPLNLLMAQICRSPQSLKTLRPDLPDRLVAIVEKALQKQPNNRFASMRHMADALHQVLVDSIPFDKTVVGFQRPNQAAQYDQLLDEANDRTNISPHPDQYTLPERSANQMNVSLYAHNLPQEILAEIVHENTLSYSEEISPLLYRPNAQNNNVIQSIADTHIINPQPRSNRIQPEIKNKQPNNETTQDITQQYSKYRLLRKSHLAFLSMFIGIISVCALIFYIATQLPSTNTELTEPPTLHGNSEPILTQDRETTRQLPDISSEDQDRPPSQTASVPEIDTKYPPNPITTRKWQTVKIYPYQQKSPHLWEKIRCRSRRDSQNQICAKNGNILLTLEGKNIYRIVRFKRTEIIIDYNVGHTTKIKAKIENYRNSGGFYSCLFYILVSANGVSIWGASNRRTLKSANIIIKPLDGVLEGSRASDAEDYCIVKP